MATRIEDDSPKYLDEEAGETDFCIDIPLFIANCIQEDLQQLETDLDARDISTDGEQTKLDSHLDGDNTDGGKKKLEKENANEKNKQKQKTEKKVFVVPNKETRQIEEQSLAIKTKGEESWTISAAIAALKTADAFSVFKSRAEEEDQKRSVAVESRAPGTIDEQNTSEENGPLSEIISDLFLSVNVNGLDSSIFKDAVEEDAQEGLPLGGSDQQGMSPIELAEFFKESIRIDGDIDKVAKVFKNGAVASGLDKVLEGRSFFVKDLTTQVKEINPQENKCDQSVDFF